MNTLRHHQLPNLLLFGATLGHALLTWPLRATIALFAGGIVVAFACEAVVIRAGLLRHRLRPAVAGVPVTLVLAWPAITYATYRVAGLVVPAGLTAATLAALLATAFDVLIDPALTAAGRWTYPDAVVSEPRFRGVPWWNFAGWLTITFVTAMLPVLAG